MLIRSRIAAFANSHSIGSFFGFPTALGETQALGAGAYLRKPYTLEALAQTVRRVLAG